MNVCFRVHVRSAVRLDFQADHENAMTAMSIMSTAKDAIEAIRELTRAIRELTERLS